MATRNEPPYQQSRATLRKLYGPRAIDARAPQSALDDTPSGRAQRYKEQGMSPRDIAQTERSRWGRMFPSSIWANQPEAPDAPGRFTMAPPPPPNNALEAIEQANATGAVTGEFATPYGQVAFDRRPRASLMPQQDAVDMSDYLGGFAPSGASPFSSIFKPKPKPSILTGAQRWVAQL